MNSHRPPIAILFAFLVASPWLANAQEAEEPNGHVSAPTVEETTAESSGWQAFLAGEIERIMGADPYGNTFQMPKGYLGIGWSMTRLRATQRYDETGTLGPILKPLEFALGDETQLNVGFNARGRGGGHTFKIGYGLADNVGSFVEIPFNHMKVVLRPTVMPVDDEGNTIGEVAAGLLGVEDRKAYNTADFIYETFPALGRPPPATKFEGQWLLGDINAGVGWNYFRGERLSAALTGRLFFPTGRIPPPEQDLFYATGPEVQTGTGGWGTAVAQTYDVRIFWTETISVVASSELTTGYFFEQRRRYPTNFVEPSPTAAGLDPASFPDLSQLRGKFNYTPGWGMTWISQLSFGWQMIGVGVGWGMQYAQKPEIDGDPGFISMVEGLGLVGESRGHGVLASFSVNLLPLSIPARVAVEYQRILGGRNLIVYDDYFKISVDAVGPLLYLWH